MATKPPVKEDVSDVMFPDLAFHLVDENLGFINFFNAQYGVVLGV